MAGICDGTSATLRCQCHRAFISLDQQPLACSLTRELYRVRGGVQPRGRSGAMRRLALVLLRPLLGLLLASAATASVLRQARKGYSSR